MHSSLKTIFVDSITLSAPQSSMPLEILQYWRFCKAINRNHNSFTNEKPKSQTTDIYFNFNLKIN